MALSDRSPLSTQVLEAPETWSVDEDVWKDLVSRFPVFGQGLDPAAFYVPMVSPDGRWLRLAVGWGSRGVDIYLADLAASGPGAPFAAVITS